MGSRARPRPLPAVEQTLAESSFPLLAEIANRQDMTVNVFDLEGNGHGQATNAGIVEFACIAVRKSGDVAWFHSLVNPEAVVSYHATRVHKIREEDVADAPSFGALLGGVRRIFDQDIVSGFGVRTTDIPHILKVAARYDAAGMTRPRRVLDVQSVWRRVADTQRGRLEDVAKFYDVVPSAPHTALGDTKTTVEVLEAMLQTHGPEVLEPFLHG